MADLIYIALTIAGFGIALVYVETCARLKAKPRT
jgi:hypothetical protein